MAKLTITASNRDRIDLKSKSTEWFIKSIQWQTYNDVELLIADGGSENYNDINNYFKSYNGKIPMRIVQHKIGDAFERALLNNVGIRNANGEYILCTDVDMLFGRDLIREVMANIDKDTFMESRTMYWKKNIVNKIYEGKIDPYNNLNDCKFGRIKKRTTAGGLQAAHRDLWYKVRGFNEYEMHGWGSEDVELLKRVKMAGFKIKWLGESVENIKVFHQPHYRNVKVDLIYQEMNKKILNHVNTCKVNPYGWGGKNNEL